MPVLDLHKFAMLSSGIQEMDALSLPVEQKGVTKVAEKSGERYPAKTIYGIVCGIRRHMERYFIVSVSCINQ